MRVIVIDAMINPDMCIIVMLNGMLNIVIHVTIRIVLDIMLNVMFCFVGNIVLMSIFGDRSKKAVQSETCRMYREAPQEISQMKSHIV